MERRDALQGAMLRRWLNDAVLPSFEHRTLPMSRDVAVLCAGLHVPDPKSERDAWIAATAMHAGLTLATRNVADFADMGVALFNPFAGSD
jgi:predicted nucleic acid-binding protein